MDAEPCNLTWQQAEGRPETAAGLDSLPDGLAFPEDFPEPIHFDPATRRLIYRGFMTNNSYRFLHTFSRDLAYMRAINELNTRSVTAELPQAAQERRWMWAALALLAILAIATVVRTVRL